MKVQISFLVLIGFLAFIILSCSNAEESMKTKVSTDLTSTNQIRQQIGIRTIKSTWFFYGQRFHADDWKLNQSGPLCKRVQYDEKDRNMLWEEDYYYSGKKFSHLDGIAWERIVIHYDYIKKVFYVHYSGTNSTIKEKFSSYRDGISDINNIADTIDSILKNWDLSRL